MSYRRLKLISLILLIVMQIYLGWSIHERHKQLDQVIKTLGVRP